MLELLLVESDVVVLGDILEWLQQVILQVLLSLLLLNHDSPLEVEIVDFLEDVEERWISASINANLLELVAEVILDRLLLKAVSLQNDVVLPLQDEAVDDKVLFL